MRHAPGWCPALVFSDLHARTARWLPIAAALGAAAACAAPDPAAGPKLGPGGIPQYPHRPLCATDITPGQVRCHAQVRTLADGKTIQVFGEPGGLGPADLASAYSAAGGGDGVVVGVVDAYDALGIESDLAVYRARFGLPACTTENGCLRIVNQSGAPAPLPAPDRTWAGESALDVEMVSALCPRCRILLVEADSPSALDLGAAVDTAALLGASVVSNSYGAPESPNDAWHVPFYAHPGVTILASSGDQGYGVSYPAADANVIAVGGTSLTRASGTTRGWNEYAWSGSGSGCSAYVPKPAHQTDSGCAQRTVADISAVADPNTGVAVYASYAAGGWIIEGGTSASAPIVAALMAARGQAGAGANTFYAQPGALFDVTWGSNGTCDVAYLCTATSGFDGPTGLGTPAASASGAGTSGGAGSGSASGASSGVVSSSNGAGGAPNSSGVGGAPGSSGAGGATSSSGAGGATSSSGAGGVTSSSGAGGATSSSGAGGATSASGAGGAPSGPGSGGAPATSTTTSTGGAGGAPGSSDGGAAGGAPSGTGASGGPDGGSPACAQDGEACLIDADCCGAGCYDGACWSSNGTCSDWCYDVFFGFAEPQNLCGIHLQFWEQYWGCMCDGPCAAACADDFCLGLGFASGSPCQQCYANSQTGCNDPALNCDGDNPYSYYGGSVWAPPP